MKILMILVVMLGIVSCGKDGANGSNGTNGQDQCQISTVPGEKDGYTGTIILCDGEEISFVKDGQDGEDGTDFGTTVVVPSGTVGDPEPIIINNGDDIVWYDANGVILGEYIITNHYITLSDGIIVNLATNEYDNTTSVTGDHIFFLEEDCKGIPFIQYNEDRLHRFESKHYIGYGEEKIENIITLSEGWTVTWSNDTATDIRTTCVNQKQLKNAYPAVEYTLPSEIINAIGPLNWGYASDLD